MKYVSPEIELLELDLLDVIQTSTIVGGESEGELGQDELPLN